jgi:hypothetical protein
MNLPWRSHRSLRRQRTLVPQGVVARDPARDFRAAWALGDPETALPELVPMRLARACLMVLPVSGAGLSLFKDDFRVPMGASDDDAAAAERLQFTQGEGPCLDAVASGRTVVARVETIERRWPTFADQLTRQTPYRGIISVPLPLAQGTSGALDLYVSDSEQIRAIPLADAATVADQIVEALQVAQALNGFVTSWTGDPVPAWMTTSPARDRVNVWIAMGVLMAALDLRAPDALSRLRAYAYAHDAVLDEIAAAVIVGRLSVEHIQR